MLKIIKAQFGMALKNTKSKWIIVLKLRPSKEHLLPKERRITNKIEA
jgi:hypothetical protein